MSHRSSKLTFFRQSGWMVFATVTGGALMYAVHIPAGRMDHSSLGGKPEYGVFLTLLQVLTQMTIPAVGLQTIVMRQTVAAIGDTQRHELSRAIRGLLAAMFVVWLVEMALTFFFQGDLLHSLKITNPAALWMAAAWGLWVLWQPVFNGLLQGRQDFLWMGWVSILGGLFRLLAVSVIVLWLGWQAAGACLGILIATAVPVALAAWQTRQIWLGPGAPVQWGEWAKRVLPLTLGPGVVTYMMSQDMIVVQSCFPKEETGFYGAAGMIGRALVFLAAALTAVMFPKVVEAAARSEKSNAMLLALGATALLGAAAALFCTVFPGLPLRVVYPASFLKVKWLVPWFAWCMLPLTLGMVLVNNLLARERYRAVPWLILVAVGYGIALRWVGSHHSSVEQGFLLVVQTLGIFSLLLVAVSLWFTLRTGPPPATFTKAPEA
jgi:O-antigen/teichoic acid export membrane protein